MKNRDQNISSIIDKLEKNFGLEAKVKNHLLPLPSIKHNPLPLSSCITYAEEPEEAESQKAET